MTKHDKAIEPADKADHALGLELIDVMHLRRSRIDGRVPTAWGSKTPCGLARTIRRIVEMQP